jgi:hypothetical protein
MGGMDAAVIMASPQRGLEWSLRKAQTPTPKSGMDAAFWRS